MSAVNSWTIESDGGRRFVLNGMWETPADVPGTYSTRSRAVFTAAASGSHSFFLVADDVGQLAGTVANEVSGRTWCSMRASLGRQLAGMAQSAGRCVA